jgi:hypothetical protein
MKRKPSCRTCSEFKRFEYTTEKGFCRLQLSAIVVKADDRACPNFDSIFSPEKEKVDVFYMREGVFCSKEDYERD